MSSLGRYVLVLVLPLLAAACDAGPYDPSAHHHSEDASTGSLLPGTDTGVNPNGGVGDPSIRSSIGAGAPGGH